MEKEIAMKGTLIVTMIIAALLFLVAPVCTAGTFSGTYKIKVSIPPVIGLNVASSDSVLQAGKIEKNNLGWETTIEVVIRGNEKIICKTTVLK
jgi:hypothetical protein